MRKTTVKAYAKINLGLKVLGRRRDGFHELRTIYQAISLHDSVEVTLGPRSSRAKVTLAMKGIEVPDGVENLAVRAAMAMREAIDLKQQVRIGLTKRIPTGGGLGGGSSDAAAVLRALDALSNQRMARRELYQIAVSLGSDVPFFLMGGRAIGVGRGEEVYQLADAPARHCLIALPADGMNTAEAYGLLKAKPWPPRDRIAGGPGDKQPDTLTGATPHPTIDLFCAALLPAVGDLGSKEDAGIENDFEPLLFRRFPKLAAAKSAMQRCGAQWASLTGSGSAVYGLFERKSQVQDAFVKLGGNDLRLFLCRTLKRQHFVRGLRMMFS